MPVRVRPPAPVYVYPGLPARQTTPGKPASLTVDIDRTGNKRRLSGEAQYL